MSTPHHFIQPDLTTHYVTLQASMRKLSYRLGLHIDHIKRQPIIATARP